MLNMMSFLTKQRQYKQVTHPLAFPLAFGRFFSSVYIFKAKVRLTFSVTEDFLSDIPTIFLTRKSCIVCKPSSVSCALEDVSSSSCDCGTTEKCCAHEY